MFQRVIATLGRHGVDEAVISLGYQPDRFTEAFPDGTCAGVALHYATEPEPLDTGGAIAFAARHAGISETFLVVNGDVLTDLDYSWLVARHRAFGAEATLHLIGVDEPSSYGVVETDADGRVLRFVEKPPAGTEPCNQVNAGTYVMEPSVLDRIPLQGRLSVERVTFPDMAADRSLFGAASDDYWIDAGTPGAYLQANLDLVSGRRGVAEPAIGDSVEITDDAVVEVAVVGDRVRVGAGARVSGSVVMDGAVIGAGAVVENSIVGFDAVIGAGAVVRDLSIVGMGGEVRPSQVLSAGREPAESTWQTQGET